MSPFPLADTQDADEQGSLRYVVDAPGSKSGPSWSKQPSFSAQETHCTHANAAALSISTVCLVGGVPRATCVTKPESELALVTGAEMFVGGARRRRNERWAASWCSRSSVVERCRENGRPAGFRTGEQACWWCNTVRRIAPLVLLSG